MPLELHCLNRQKTKQILIQVGQMSLQRTRTASETCSFRPTNQQTTHGAGLFLLYMTQPLSSYPTTAFLLLILSQNGGVWEIII